MRIITTATNPKIDPTNGCVWAIIDGDLCRGPLNRDGSFDLEGLCPVYPTEFLSQEEIDSVTKELTTSGE